MTGHAATWHVWQNSTFDGPGTAWSNAFHDVQSAVDAATPGDEVLVRPGIYATGGRTAPGMVLTNRVVIDKAIVVSSTDGPHDTIIEGCGGEGGDDAIRGVYMANGAILDGFTIRLGRTLLTSEDADEQGGGVYMADSACLVRNSIIRDNGAMYGGGVRGGNVHHTLIQENSYLTPPGMRSLGGGGAYQSTLYFCTIVGNYASDLGGGGGLLDCDATRCLIEGNGAAGGGGAAASRLYACVVRRNLASTGGGISGGEAYSTLIYSNDAYNAAGAENTLLVNCTVVENRASDKIGGVHSCTVVNSIVWSNRSNIAWHNPDYMAGSFSYSCTPVLPSGPGNIDQAPAFLDWANQDYRLTADSPCLDAGTTAHVEACPIDVEGNPRWFGTAPDMGASEACVLFGAIASSPPLLTITATVIPGRTYALEASIPGPALDWQPTEVEIEAETTPVTFEVETKDSIRQYRLVALP